MEDVALPPTPSQASSVGNDPHSSYVISCCCKAGVGGESSKEHHARVPLWSAWAVQVGHGLLGCPSTQQPHACTGLSIVVFFVNSLPMLLCVDWSWELSYVGAANCPMFFFQSSSYWGPFLKDISHLLMG